MGDFLQYWHYRIEVDQVGNPLPGATWQQLGTECRGINDPVVAAAARQRPSLAQLILAEWRRVDLAPAVLRIQPPGGTLVNLPAILSARDAAASFDVQLLGRPVTLFGIPVRYTWHFGDGATLQTAGPGRPYPAKDITHLYRRHGAYDVSVDVTYRGEYSVAGGPRQPLPGETTVAGAAETLLVRQATTRLVSH